jgi:hypothetical protein
MRRCARPWILGGLTPPQKKSHPEGWLSHDREARLLAGRVRSGCSRGRCVSSRSRSFSGRSGGGRGSSRGRGFFFATGNESSGSDQGGQEDRLFHELFLWEVKKEFLMGGLKRAEPMGTNPELGFHYRVNPCNLSRRCQGFVIFTQRGAVCISPGANRPRTTGAADRGRRGWPF